MIYKIMVVDDDRSTLEVMDLILRRIGYDPVVYGNGVEALEWLEENRTDLILLDLQMFPMDGWEFLRRLREGGATRDIPVMLFTARPLIDDERERAGRSVIRVLEKPVSPRELKQRLEEYFLETGTGPSG